MPQQAEDGTLYRVRHERVYHEHEFVPVSADDPPAAKGGRTVVEILNDDGDVLATGVATCRPDENFNRRLGRTIALGRARKKLIVTKSGRVLTESEIEALADEAEAGYDVAHLKARTD